MGSKYLKNTVKRGVSDLIIVLALISVAIPVTLAVQHWLSSQVGKATTYSVTPKISANLISIDYRNGNFTALIEVINRGVADLNLSNVNATVILTNGSNIVTTPHPVFGRQTLEPNEEATLLLTISDIKSKAVLIVLEFKDAMGSRIPIELTVN
ncbi:MAG: hypothetical protein QXO98_03010 [Sulfolobales archaeon]